MAINRQIEKASVLAAVNTIISNIGQAPVNDLDTVNPMVQMAEQTLNEVNRTVQAEGWVFNTERDYPFILDSNGELPVPFDVIAWDLPPGDRCSLVQRDGRLYNKTDHTFKFEHDLELDVVRFFNFDDLPEAFKNYITVRAANLFAGRSVGSPEAVRFGQQEELQARAAMMEYETQQGDYTFFEERDGSSVYNAYAYRPINTVRRR